VTGRCLEGAAAGGAQRYRDPFERFRLLAQSLLRRGDERRGFGIVIGSE